MTLSCAGYEFRFFSALDFSQPKNLNPYCAQMRSKGSLRQHLPFPPAPFPGAGKGGLYQQSLHKNASAAPYKRRRVGRNLRLSRTDPTLCSGQPSPLRCILLSPQGLTTLRGPRLYGVYRRVGVSGSSPSDFWLLFFIEKYPRRVGVPALHPAKSMPRRQATTNSAQKFFCILLGRRCNLCLCKKAAKSRP